MSVIWNPEGNPVHFLIELHDVLRGGFDRFLTVNPRKESLFAEQRQSLETLRLTVYNQISYGVVRESLIDDAISYLMKKANQQRLEFDQVKPRPLIENGMVGAMKGLTQIPPVHLGDLLDKRKDSDERNELDSQCRDQSNLMTYALNARRDLLKILSNIDDLPPREIRRRSVSGEEGSVRFQELKPVVPKYRGNETPSSSDPSKLPQIGATGAAIPVRKPTGGRPRLGNGKRETEKEKALHNLYMIIQNAGVKLTVATLQAHFKQNADFKKKVTEAERTYGMLLFRAAIDWIKNQKTSSENVS